MASLLERAVSGSSVYPPGLGYPERPTSIDGLEVLNELRHKGLLCDVLIRVEGGQFSVHRAVMATCSPYFQALFTNGMHATGKREVFIPGVTQDMMGHIIEYAYTRTTDISDKNVERLLPAADQFNVLGLLKACCSFLANEVQVENVIGIHRFARSYFCAELEKMSQTFLLENFPEVAENSEELLALPLSEMLELMESDELGVRHEETVFEAALRWIAYDPYLRNEHIQALLQCVRLGRLSTQFFMETVKVHPLIKDNELCRPLIIETVRLLYDLNMGSQVDISYPLSRPRIPHEILFVVGGWSAGFPTNAMETYNPCADRWTLIECSDTGPRAYHGCATLGRHLYVIGGFDGHHYFNSVRRFDTTTKTWDEVGPMYAQRCYVSVTVLDGRIYAMGGYNGRARQNTAERYTPADNQWSFIAPMNVQRSDASATTLADKVYIAGGFNGEQCVSSAECYDAGTNQWTMISPMHYRRSGVGVASHGGFLYALGGFNGISRQKSGEKYNPATNTWVSIADMEMPRSNFGIEVTDGMISVMGGFNGITTIYDVECYDPNCNEWDDCADMNVYRSALSVCVLRGLPYVRDYIHPRQENYEEHEVTEL